MSILLKSPRGLGHGLQSNAFGLENSKSAMDLTAVICFDLICGVGIGARGHAGPLDTTGKIQKMGSDGSRVMPRVVRLVHFGQTP